MKIKDSFDRLSVCASVCMGLHMQVFMLPGMQVLMHMRAYASVNKGTLSSVIHSSSVVYLSALRQSLIGQALTYQEAWLSSDPKGLSTSASPRLG